ncbi:hypothetical protein M758_7G166400 [Ceratodon purpureus]|nr:hypothetical protein M758_7G166400 [Ceratodon purpureus]
MGKNCKTEACQFSHPERRGTLSYPSTPGTNCLSERGSRGGSESPRRSFSPSRGFSDRDEACPDDEGANPLDFDFCGSIKDVTEPRMPLTQKRRLVPYYGIYRDKESLVEEMELLLNAFQDQKYHFRSHKMHHEAVEALNSKLEGQIEYLETSGLEAARSGTLTKLKAKLKGAKFRIMETQMTCAANSAEMRRLNMNAQVMKSQVLESAAIPAFGAGEYLSTLAVNEFLVKQEAKVQREEYATEVRRLQKIVRKLRILYKKVLDDNSEVARLRDDVPALTAKIQKQEASVTELNKTLNDMTTEIADWKAKRVAAQYARASDDKRYLSLEGDNKSLIDLLTAEKVAHENIGTMVNELGHQVRLAERENRENATSESGF